MNPSKTFLQVSYLSKVPVITFGRLCAYEADMDWHGWARPGLVVNSTALHLLGQQVHASKQSEHPFWNLGRKCTPHPYPGHSLQESWVMKVFPAILYRTESHLTLLSLSVEEAATGPPPPRASELPGPALWHHPVLVASKQACHLPVLSTHGVCFLWRGFLHSG